MSAARAQTDVREKLLEAGRQVIVAKSYNGCGLKEILDVAGVPKGSFYHYFKSKEDFGVAMIERSTEEHAEWMRSVLADRRQPAMQRIRAFYEEMRDCQVQRGTQHECLVAKLSLELCQLSEPMRAAIKYTYDYYTAILAKTLREAQAEGALAPHHDPEALANFLTNAWEGACMRMQAERSTKPIEEFIAFTFGTLLQPGE